MIIFLDMDGVVADFVRHIRNLNIPYNNQWGQPRETWTAETLAGEEIKERAMHTPGFWRDIPEMDGALELYQAVHQFKPFFLTAKPREHSEPWIGREKLDWVRDHLDPEFPTHRMIVCNIGSKGPYARPGYVLIDDDLKRNGKEWTEAGGTFIHYAGPQDLHKVIECLN